MPGGVYQVKCIPFPFDNVFHLYGMAFYCDPAFAFQIHVVKHLSLEVFPRYGVGVFQKTVGQGALAVVDMSYYAEIANVFHDCKITKNS